MEGTQAKVTRAERTRVGSVTAERMTEGTEEDEGIELGKETVSNLKLSS